MKKCEATGCPKEVPSHMLMCFSHWSRVPIGLQNAVWKAWRKLQKGEEGAHLEHRKAKAEAIKSLGPADTTAPASAAPGPVPNDPGR